MELAPVGVQLWAMVRLSLARLMRSRHLWTAIALAALPLLLVLARSIFVLFVTGFSFADPIAEVGAELRWGIRLDADEVTAHSIIMPFQAILIGGYFHFGLFFSAILFGNSALREELDDQTLHYLYLQPVRRWIVIAGKYLAYLLVAGPVFCASVIGAQLALLVPYGFKGMSNVLITDGRLTSLFLECGVVLIALAVFSALFMALGSIFRSLFFAILFYGWEMASSLMPTTLKNYSLTYYFKHLLPDDAARKTAAFEILADPPGAMQTTLVLIGVLGVSLAISIWQANRRECLYA